MDPLHIKIEEIGLNPIKKEEEQAQIKKEEQGQKQKKKKTAGVTRRIRRSKDLLEALKRQKLAVDMVRNVRKVRIRQDQQRDRLLSQLWDRRYNRLFMDLDSIELALSKSAPEQYKACKLKRNIQAAVAMVMQLDEEMPVSKNYQEWEDQLENIISVIARGDYCDQKFEI